MPSRSAPRLLSLAIAVLLTIQPTPSALAAQETQPPKLNIIIVEGEGAVNNIKSRTAREVIVQVEDENRKPIGGAIISVTLPNQGPGANFVSGGKSLVSTTDSNGRLSFRIRPNNVTGEYNIRVTATHQNVSVTKEIAQSNAALAAAGISLTWITILAAAGAAAVGATVALRDSGAAPPAPVPPTTISAGGTRVGQ